MLIEDLINQALKECKADAVDVNVSTVLSVLNEKHQDLIEEIKAKKKGEKIFTQMASMSLKPGQYRYENLYEADILSNKYAFEEIYDVKLRLEVKTTVGWTDAERINLDQIESDLETFSKKQYKSNPLYALEGNDLYIFPLITNVEIPSGIKVWGGIIPNKLELTDDVNNLFCGRIKRGHHILKEAVKSYIYRAKERENSAVNSLNEYENFTKPNFIKRLTRKMETVYTKIP